MRDCLFSQPSDAELSCNTPTTGYYEPDFYLDVAPPTPMYSYIQEDLHYMKKPIHPYDKKGGQKHFHVPAGRLTSLESLYSFMCIVICDFVNYGRAGYFRLCVSGGREREMKQPYSTRVQNWNVNCQYLPDVIISIADANASGSGGGEELRS